MSLYLFAESAGRPAGTSSSRSNSSSRSTSPGPTRRCQSDPQCTWPTALTRYYDHNPQYKNASTAIPTTNEPQTQLNSTQLNSTQLNSTLLNSTLLNSTHQQIDNLVTEEYFVKVFSKYGTVIDAAVKRFEINEVRCGGQCWWWW